MTLGELLAQFEDETVAAETVLRIGDLAMIAMLSEEAQARGITFGACASDAAHRYAANASDDEWITLIGAMNRADDPGAVYLRRAFAHAARAASGAPLTAG